MGVAPDAAASAIRVSLGWATAAEDVDRLVAAWGDLYARTRNAAA
jgi:cysteine desulfurase